MPTIRARILDRLLRVLTARPLDPKVDPRAFRKKFDQLAVRLSGKIKGVDVEKCDIDSILGEWLWPKGVDRNIGTQGTLLYLHGGGYILGSPDTHRAMVASLVRNANTRALLIDYRLAPEHPFPAGVEDAVKAYRWLLDQGIAPDTITVAGDSAGGGLTMALLLSLRDAGIPLPAGAALLSPWTDLAMSGWTHITHRKRDPMISLDGALLAARHYLGATNPTNPLASPLYGQFDGLPPLFIHVGGNEILLDDSLRLADRARTAGVHVEIKVWNDLPHVFQAASFLPEARQSLKEIAAFLKTQMARKSVPEHIDTP